jgi:hypothetical protein
MHHQGYRYRIVLLRLSPTVVLVVCLRCQQLVTACPDHQDALWAAAVHAVRGVG